MKGKEEGSDCDRTAKCSYNDFFDVSLLCCGYSCMRSSLFSHAFTRFSIYIEL